MTTASGQKTDSFSSRGPLLWTVGYLLLASIWIWLTQWLLSEVGGYSWRISTTGLVFGEIFVLVTGGGLFLLLRYFMVPSDSTGADRGSEGGPSGRRWIISLMIVVGVMLIGQVLLSWYAARAYAPSLVDKARADAEALASIRADRIDHWLSLHRRDIESLSDRRELLTSISGQDMLHHEALSGYLSGLISQKRFDAITIVDPEHTRKLHMGLASVGSHVPDGLFEQAAATAEIRFGASFVPGSTAIDCYWVLPVFLDRTEVSGGPWYLVFRARLNGVSLEQYSRVSAASLFKNSSQWLLQTTKSTVQAPLSLRLAGTAREQSPDASVLSLPSIQSMDPDKLPAAVRLPIQSGESHLGRTGLPANKAESLVSGTGMLDGVSVIYAALPLPAMQAVLLTSIDRAQVLAPVTRLEKWLSIGALIGTIAILSALLVLWRLVRRMHDMRLASEMSERDRLLLQFYNLPMIGMAVIDPETLEVERVNQRLAHIYHTDPSALVGTPFDDLVADEDATPIQHTLDQQSVRGLVAGQFDELSLERTVTLPDHVQVCVHMNVRAVRLPSGFVTALVATVDDVTEEKMQAQLLSCQRDLYHMSARTAAALIAVDDPQAMYKDVCHIAVTGTSFTSVCLFLLDETHQLRLVACDGENPDCTSAFQGQGAIDQLGREWLDRALTSRQPIFISDLSSTSLPASSVSWGRRHRMHSVAILPLEHEGQVSGALVLGSRTTGLWTDAVRKVLGELAGQLARAQAALDADRTN